MKRIITVFALLAALVVLMGCGVKSKKEEQKAEPQAQVPAYTLVAGDYAMGSGEILKAEAGYMGMVNLKEARARKDEFDKKLALLSPQTEEAVVADDEKKLREEAAQHADALKNLEDTVIERRFKSLSFSLWYNEASKKYRISDLKIITDKDTFVNHLENSEHIEDNENDYCSACSDILFGGVDKLNHEVQFDSNTGDLSFSFVQGKEENARVYTFAAKASNPQAIEGKPGFSRVALEGTIVVTKPGSDETLLGSLLQLGQWRAEHIIEAPKVEVKAEQEQTSGPQLY